MRFKWAFAASLVMALPGVALAQGGAGGGAGGAGGAGGTGGTTSSGTNSGTGAQGATTGGAGAAGTPATTNDNGMMNGTDTTATRSTSNGQVSPNNSMADTGAAAGKRKHHKKHHHTSGGEVNANTPDTANQTQSGVTNKQGSSTLGTGVTKTSPTAGEPVTAKGDTLRKGRDSTPGSNP